MDCCDDMKNAQRWKSDLAYWQDRNGDAFIISALYDLIDAIDATIEHHVCKGEDQVQQEDVQQEDVQQEDVQQEDVQQEDVQREDQVQQGEDQVQQGEDQVQQGEDQLQQGEDQLQEVDDRDCVPMDCS